MELIIFIIFIYFLLKKSKAKQPTNNQNTNQPIANNMPNQNVNQQARTVNVNNSNDNRKYDNNMTMHAKQPNTNNNTNNRKLNDYKNYLENCKYTDLKYLATLLNIPESQVVKDIKNYQKMGFFKTVKFELSNHKIVYSDLNPTSSQSSNVARQTNANKAANKNTNAHNSNKATTKNTNTHSSNNTTTNTNTTNANKNNNYEYVNKETKVHNADLEFKKKQLELDLEEENRFAKNSVEEEAINLDVNFGTFSSFDFNSFDYLPSFNSLDFLDSIDKELV